MIFAPVSRAQACQLRDGTAAHDVRAQGPTPSLATAHGYDEFAGEEADYAALAYAGVRSVIFAQLDGEPRLVLAADIELEDCIDSGDAFGSVTVPTLRWEAVTAVFSDEDASTPLVAAARSAATGATTLEEATARAAVSKMMDEADLGWYDPSELDSLCRDVS